MFFVMVEISNYRQLERLRGDEASSLRSQLEHFCNNRGGKLAREQNGFFLFTFHPLREKVLDQVSDFVLLAGESLHKKQQELFGFSVLLDEADGEEDSVFHRLKSAVFTVPRAESVWATAGARTALGGLLPLSDDVPLAEILGPPAQAERSPLPIETLVEMTGWVAALKVPLERQLADAGTKPGKILRLKGGHLVEKYFVLRTVLHQIYGAHEDFPVLFPLEESRDVLSQLLARVDPAIAAVEPAPDPAWTTMLASRGGGEYPGDAGTEDVAGALGHYFKLVVRHWTEQNLPPVFVFLFPHNYHSEAQAVLEGLLAPLVAHQGLRLLLLEHPDGVNFMGRHPSLSWAFPPLTLERVTKERDARGWTDRFPFLTKTSLEACDGRGMAWAHHLWALQEGVDAPVRADPSWTLLERLESTYHKIYYVLCTSRGLLDEEALVAFFEHWGEDAAVIRDKVAVLRAMGFFPSGLWKPLRPDFSLLLADRLGQEGRDLSQALSRFLLDQWHRDHRMSEVLFAALPAPASTSVLDYYLTAKVNQGRGDFLTLLRPSLWENAGAESDALRLSSASAKLRFALNLPDSAWAKPTMDRFRRPFGPRTESVIHGEWLLQKGRFQLRFGDWTEGFGLLKRALLTAQETGDAALEVRAESEVGLALLRRNRLEEGREYFEIASRLAERTGSSYLMALTATPDAVALFLLGRLSLARAVLERGRRACDQGGLRRRRVFLHFVAARIAFDQGGYAEASAELAAALALASKYRVAGADSVLVAWKARCDVYAGHGGRLVLDGLAASAERSFFLAEAHALDKDYRAAAAALDAGLAIIPPTAPFGSGEQVSWNTGFGSIEDLLVARPGDTGVLRHQMEGFRAYLSGMTGNPEQAAKDFQGLLSRKFLLEIDPASAQLFYWYYLVLPPSDPAQEAQRLTLLGRSLKDVQTRSSRIEDPVQRQDFLAKPYWNARFAQEARRVKLL
jgi:tetratricopeptide (TPR) repeat protein